MVWMWVGFIGLVLGLLALDLGILHKRDHQPTFLGSLGWTAFWVVLSLAFKVAVYFIYESNWMGIAMGSGDRLSGGQAGLQFLTGYLVEKSLSVDNVFVIAMILLTFVSRRLTSIESCSGEFWGRSISLWRD